MIGGVGLGVFLAALGLVTCFVGMNLNPFFVGDLIDFDLVDPPFHSPDQKFDLLQPIVHTHLCLEKKIVKIPLSNLFHVPSPHLLLQLLDYNYSKEVEFFDHHFLSSLTAKFEEEGDTVFCIVQRFYLHLLDKVGKLVYSQYQVSTTWL